MQRGEPAHILEIKGIEEEEPAEAGEGSNGDDRGRGEGDRSEEAGSSIKQLLPRRSQTRSATSDTAATMAKAQMMSGDEASLDCKASIMPYVSDERSVITRSCPRDVHPSCHGCLGLRGYTRRARTTAVSADQEC